MVKNNKPYSLLKKWEAIPLRIFNGIHRIKNLFSSVSWGRHIKNNAELRNVESGKTCYIVMGGLSVLKINLEHINNRDIITANNFFRTDDYIKIKPKYHVIVDANFFVGCEQVEILNKTIQDFTTVFLNSRKMAPVAKKNIRYIYPVYRVVDESIEIDISKACSNFSTVTLTCIQIAIYLGYKEINIVGFDFPPGHMPHYYRESDFEKISEIEQKNCISEYDYCELFWQYTNCHHEAYRLSNYAISNGIKIYNTSPSSFVRAFTYKNYYQT